MFRTRPTRLTSRLVVLALTWCFISLSPRHASARQWCSQLDDSVLADLVARGVQRSATFRDLVMTLERSNLIVHVQRSRGGMPNSAFTQFVASGNGYRFVRITISVERATDTGVALLGHELQHAVEVAERPEVADVEAYEGLYRTIGYTTCARVSPCYDTGAAIEMGRRVLKELRG